MKSNLPKQTNVQQKQQPKKSRLPIPEEMQNMGKAAAAFQLFCFLAVFLTVYLLLRQVVHTLPLRILILIGDYIFTALITYLLIRPAALKLDAKLKKK